jgi:hypothetical protein
MSAISHGRRYTNALVYSTGFRVESDSGSTYVKYIFLGHMVPPICPNVHAYFHFLLLIALIVIDFILQQY